MIGSGIMGEYLAHGKVAVVTMSTRRIRQFGLYFEDPLWAAATRCNWRKPSPAA